MKLRNKKTGEIVELRLIQVNDKYIADHEVDFLNGEKLTLKLLANSFDDVKEPLIKDEKIRKIVRPWANKNMVKRLTVRYKWGEGTALESCGAKITFYDDLGLRNGVAYTIAELCGEEEE